MDKQNLMPQVAQPVNRITTGQLPAELAELSEETLELAEEHNRASVQPSGGWVCLRPTCILACSYDGDDAE